MTDGEFLACNGFTAMDILRKISDPGEVERLIRLYKSRHWLALGGVTVANLTNGNEHKRVERLEQFSLDQLYKPSDASEPSSATSATSVNSLPIHAGLPTESIMRLMGIFLFSGGLLFSIFAWMVAFNANDVSNRIESASFAWLLASIAGLGVFMWMLGIIEQRLIEIRAVLSERIQKASK